MRSFDMTPLYRTIVGFDRLADLIDEAAKQDPAGGGFPPYNIEQHGENAYRIDLAVAGFSPEELAIEVRDATLIIAGKKTPREDDVRFVHRGIAERAFERRFRLADHVVVRDARLANGLLQIDLEREIPEALKPRRIAISTDDSRDAIAKPPQAANTQTAA
ncbi:MAG: Hsp20 family protein [Maricaulaceae bacterium]